MTSNKGMGPKKQFWPIRMKLGKPFRRQLTHYVEKFLHELLSNISLINCPTPIGSTKIRPLTSCVISLAQYILRIDLDSYVLNRILLFGPHLDLYQSAFLKHEITVCFLWLSLSVHAGLLKRLYYNVFETGLSGLPSFFEWCTTLKILFQ